MTISPDISAENGAGATGCARGSQLCSGTSPALVPKPISAAIATSVCPPALSGPGAASASSAIHTPAPPRCVIAM